MTNEQIEKYSENGKFEVREITVQQSGKNYSCIVAFDFEMLLKAQDAMMDTTVRKAAGTNDEPIVNVKVQPLKAGDKILFFGFKEGDAEIRTKMLLRRKACAQLGKMVQDIMEDEESDIIEEKKS